MSNTGRISDFHADFDHLETAAFRAIALRRFADNFAALALPPFKPPNRPSATAAGFLAGLGVD